MTGVVQFLNRWLNAIGLVLGMAGVAIVWRFGWPQPSFEDGVSIFVEDGTRLPNGRTAGQLAATNRALKARYAIYSPIGLSLILAGFFCQLGHEFLCGWLLYGARSRLCQFEKFRDLSVRGNAVGLKDPVIILIDGA